MNSQEEFPTNNITASEIEGGNFMGYITSALKSKGAYDLIGLIEEDKINLESDKQRIIEAGNAAEKVADQNGEEFNSTAHFIKRGEELANELMKKQKSLTDLPRN